MPKRDSYDGPGVLVAPDVLCLPVLITNVCLIGKSEAVLNDWVLVDAGLTNSSERIVRAAAARFGSDSRPVAIILTHGHFDHIGAVRELADKWDVPVFAHPLEAPYLTGRRDYPPPDPTVGGGLVAWLSPLFPRKGIDLGVRLRPLPENGSIPGMPGWRWIHTPGHTPGHVSLFRDSDRILIAGDAIVTVKQESALAVLMQEKELHGPPAYFTTDWDAAKASVQLLESLNPEVVVAGHGQPMRGPELSRQLEDLAEEFDRLALPDQGHYLPHGDADGKETHP